MLLASCGYSCKRALCFVKPGLADKYSEGTFFAPLPDGGDGARKELFLLVHKGLAILNKKTSLEVYKCYMNSNSVSYSLGSVHYIRKSRSKTNGQGAPKIKIQYFSFDKSFEKGV